MMKQNDAELVRRTRQGDRAAFGELVARYRQMVYGLCYHQVGQFENAQDLGQEAFVSISVPLCLCGRSYAIAHSRSSSTNFAGVGAPVSGSQPISP